MKHPGTDHAWQAIVLARWARQHRLSLMDLATKPEFRALASKYRQRHPVGAK